MNHILKALTPLLVFAVNFSYAQSNRYDWGIEGGPNLSTLRMKDHSLGTIDAIICASAGFIFQYNTRKILSFKTGFSYQRKGFDLTTKHFLDYSYSDKYKEKHSVNYDYITLPLLVKASFGKKVKFFVNAGPYVGFLLARRESTILFSDFNSYHLPSSNNINGAKRFDWGIASGIGVAVPIKKSWTIHAEVRNYYGLYDLDVRHDSYDTYNNTTDLRLGVVYRLGFRDSE